MVLFSVNATVPLTAKRPHRHHNSSLTVFEWDRNTTERRSGPFKTTRLMVKLHQACTYVLASEGLPDKAFSEQKCTKCRLAAGLRPDPLEGLQRSPNPIAVLRALLDKAFSYKMQQMSLGGRAPPGPAGGTYSVPSDPLAALKLLGPSALDPWRHAFGVRRQSVPVLFSPFEH